MAPATENAVQVLTNTKSNYKVIAFALDLTGKKLIDEICHITACEGTTANQFDQYIMTYRDISRSSVRTHGIRIFTMLGKYRVLKDMNTMKSLHTKSEYSTLNDFLEWLVERKGSSEGVILTYHDSGMDKVTPFLMEALERYQLTDEFFKVVKGFVNCCSIASSHPDAKGKSLGLRSLARRLLGEDEIIDKIPDLAINGPKKVIENGHGEEKKEVEKDHKEVNGDKSNKENVAVEEKPAPEENGGKKPIDTTTTGRRRSRKGSSRDKSKSRQRNNKERESFTAMQSSKFRAMTTYKLLHKFAPSPTEPTIFEDELLKHLSTREEELQAMVKQRELATKVRSLRPIFLGKIRTSPKDRSRAVLLRRYLIEAALDYDTLKQAYETGSTEAIVKIAEETSAKKKKQHLDELVELIVNHFKVSPKKDVNANEVKNGAGGEAGAGAAGDGDQKSHFSAADDDGTSTGTDSGDDSEAEFQEATGDN